MTPETNQCFPDADEIWRDFYSKLTSRNTLPGIKVSISIAYDFFLCYILSQQQEERNSEGEVLSICTPNGRSLTIIVDLHT